MNWMANEQPSAAKLEGADYFANIDKPIQPDLLSESRRKKRTKKSADNASASGKSAILLTDSSMGQPNVSNDDDDFVDPPPRRQDTPLSEKSPIDEALSAAHNSPDEPHPHMPQWVDISGLKSKRSRHRIHGVGDKGTHVARGSDKTDEPNVDRKGKGKIDPSEDIGTPYSLQPPSFDLGIGYTQPEDVHSEDIQKQVDSIISDVLTATKSVHVEESTSPDGRSELPVKRVSRPARILQSPFVVGEGKLFKHDDHVIVFEHFKGDIEEVDRSTFVSWFQRGLKPKNKYL
ncbi:Hypothetical predicted protein [Olea europaea subsp. europaea]|uniref:Uncharacterized protein n=1 Tax=Olea europaea subsp. europaea TaxID=158383 RepID=A0A8S0QXB1_OLEEU|nr:Hypothetical predicted protein [Olea europaea subsp. europaea]